MEEFDIEKSDLYKDEQAKMEKNIAYMESIIGNVIVSHKRGQGNLAKEIAMELYKNGIGVENIGWN